jgi:hypothetical protein
MTVCLVLETENYAQTPCIQSAIPKQQLPKSVVHWRAACARMRCKNTHTLLIAHSNHSGPHRHVHEVSRCSTCLSGTKKCAQQDAQSGECCPGMKDDVCICEKPDHILYTICGPARDKPPLYSPSNIQTQHPAHGSCPAIRLPRYMPASVITYAARHQTNARVPTARSAQHNTNPINTHTGCCREHD